MAGQSAGVEMYGAGAFFVIGADGTPRKLAMLQGCSLDAAFTTKALYAGDSNVAVAIARGTGKFTGKVDIARVSADVFNEVFFGQSAATGQILSAQGETHTIATSTVTATHAATIFQDLGVRYATTNRPLTKVTSAPALGQYSVSAGVYTFNASETGDMVLDYLYTDAANGKTITLASQPIGTTPFFTGVFTVSYAGKTKTVILNKLTSSKLGIISSKLEDWDIVNFDFEAVADASGILGYISLSE